MKRITMFMMALTISMFMISAANAAVSGGVTAAGATITITPIASNVPGADAMIFNPSPQVQMSFYSNADGFSANGVHAAALGTSGGQAYGMAGDTNKVYFISVKEDTAVLVAVATATSVEFETTQAYSPMQ